MNKYLILSCIITLFIWFLTGLEVGYYGHHEVTLKVFLISLSLNLSMGGFVTYITYKMIKDVIEEKNG